jgi:hypothetical protein
MATTKTRRSRRSTAAKKTARRKPAAKKKTAAKKSVARTSRARKPAKAAAKKRRIKTAKPSVRAKKKTAAPSARSVRRAPTKRKAKRVKKKAHVRREVPVMPVDTSLFPCGDAAVRAATGKTWNEWLELLDAAGAAKQAFDHQRIWELAMQALPDSAGWWGQMVSVGYERVRGLREKNQGSGGSFQSTSSKTFAVPLFAAFAAWADAGLRGNWLDAPGLNFTKLNVGRNIRARWPDGTLLDIRFTDSGPDKCQVVIDTMKLSDADAVQNAKTYWQGQLDRLQAYLRA